MRKILLTFICFHTYVLTAQIMPGIHAVNLQHVLDSVCAANNIKGVSAAVYVPGHGYWAGTYGESHAGMPIQKEMYFPIGSNTKTYVAASMLRLQEQGALSLNDNIGKWISHPNVNGSITIRQLLGHTSGLYNYMNNYDFILAWNADFTKVWNGEDMLQFIKSPVAAPGTQWNYSNTNYLLAGIILSKVTGKPLQDAIRDLILTPAGLKNVFLFPHEQPNANIPHGWSDGVTQTSLADMYKDIGYVNTAFLSMAAGAGGLISTAEDNVRFWQQLMEHKIVNAASLAEMKQLCTLPGADPYGLGMYQWLAHGHTIYNHPGTCFAFLNENLYDSDNGACITILTNQDSVNNNYLFPLVVIPLHDAILKMPPATVSGVAQKAQHLSVFPNPASDRVYISLPAPIQRVRMLDMQGRVVVQQQGENTGYIELALQGIAAGQYIVEAVSGEETLRTIISVSK